MWYKISAILSRKRVKSIDFKKSNSKRSKKVLIKWCRNNDVETILMKWCKNNIDENVEKIRLSIW